MATERNRPLREMLNMSLERETPADQRKQALRHALLAIRTGWRDPGVERLQVIVRAWDDGDES